jgi:hypothetical protein
MPHQQRVIDKNPRKAILAFEMRVGKTLPACFWIDHPCRAGNTFIITPKQNVKDWERMKTRARILTKEQFKKTEIINPTALVVDEAQAFASGLFTKQRSQMSTALYELVKKYPNMDILLLTATPIRQDPWSLHTLLCFIGVYYPFKEWRKEFFSLTKLPFLLFPAWLPNNDWRIKIRKYLEKHCDIVSLKDIVPYLPPAETIIVKVKTPKYVRPVDQVVTWADEHRHEQSEKIKEILALGYRKLIVVCHYTSQIDEYEKELSKEKPVFILDGRTKDADAVKKTAQQADDCYFIVQASMGFAFDGYMFGAIVFASMSHSCLAHTQMTGRLRHFEHLHPVFYYYLIGGRWDQRIYDCIDRGKDFNPFLYMNK